MRMNGARWLMAGSVAAVSLAMSGAVLAAGDDPPGDDHGNGIGRGGAGVGSSNHIGSFHGAEAASRALLSTLHNRLGVTSSQEAAWQAFVTAIVAEAADADTQNSHTTAFTTAVDALNARAAALKKQSDDASAVAQSFSTLYAQLTTAQKAIVDLYFSRGGPL